MKTSTESVSGKGKLIIALVLLFGAIAGVGALMFAEIPLKQQKVEKVLNNETVIY